MPILHSDVIPNLGGAQTPVRQLLLPQITVYHSNQHSFTGPINIVTRASSTTCCSGSVQGDNFEFRTSASKGMTVGRFKLQPTQKEAEVCWHSPVHNINMNIKIKILKIGMKD